MNLINKNEIIDSSNLFTETQNDELVKLYNLKHYTQAITLARYLIQDDENILAHNILGLSLYSNGQESNAFEVFSKAIQSNPKDSSLFNNLSNLYLRSKNFIKAKYFAQKAVNLNPLCSNSYFTLGISLNANNQKKDAILAFKKSFKLEKSNSSALLQIGNIYKDIKEFTKSIEIYRKHQKLFPHIVSGYWNESTIHLRNQRFKIGWDKYETGIKNDQRFLIDGFHREKKLVWDGKPFEGTLLIYGEQGLGDQIIFSTLLPDLLKIQSRIILKVNKKLLNFYSYNFKNIRVYSETDTIPEESYKKFIAIGSLCKFLRTKISDFENSSFKNFDVPNQNLNVKKLFTNSNPIVGISWYTTSFQTGVNRSLSPVEISKIINKSKFNFINLQYGGVADQIQTIQKLTNNALISFPELDLTDDIVSLSNLILKCDLVLTIDNTTAHLSSSLGQKTWVLLPYSADFRWFENTSKSLWYKNTTLFRQSDENKWKSILENILSKLKSKEK